MPALRSGSDVAEQMAVRHTPDSPEEAAETLGKLVAGGEAVRFVGGGTKQRWGAPPSRDVVGISTQALDRVLEHNAGDMTAVLQAGVPLARAQERFAGAGQMLALDPPNPGGSATLGGVVACAASGPLRHRYGGVRDLLLGVRVALPDGTLVRSGGRVIKNVAGYDLAKLLAGSFGTLGMIVEVVVRLHPVPPGRATVAGVSTNPEMLGRAVSALAALPLELESLDVRWGDGRGAVLARVAGSATPPRVAIAASAMRGFGLDIAIEEDDDAQWVGQRAAQRSAEGTVVRVSGLRSDLPAVLRAAARAGAWVVGRAGLGLSWVTLPAGSPAEVAAAVGELRSTLAPRPCVVLDAPDDVRAAVDVWGPQTGPVELMRRVKERFDPSGACNPGVFVGGL
jgi:glycolate oxidase FAD binding subunit